MRTRRLVLMSALLVAGLMASAPRASAQTTISSCGTISSSGSYILTKNLSSLTNCLIVAASDVTLDLAGFTIFGSHAGSGITDLGTGRSLIVVRNGAVVGFKVGIALGASNNVQIDRMLVSGNTNDGINGGQYAEVHHTRSHSNGGNGVVLGGDSEVTDSRTSANLLRGIVVGQQARVIGNLSNNNTGTGIATLDRAMVSGNQASSNKGDGIAVGTGADIIGNTANLNKGNGISVEGVSLVRDNVTNFDATGIFGDEGGSLVNNQSFGNSKDGINTNAGSKVLLSGNSSSGNTAGFGIVATCPSNLVGNIEAGNKHPTNLIGIGCTVSDNNL